MRRGKIRLWALAPVLVAVCAAGWWAGGFCGTEAAAGYYHRGPNDFNFFRDGKALLGEVGAFPGWDNRKFAGHYFPWWWGLSGLVAGALWCLVMVLRARRMVARHGKAGPSLMVLGALVGRVGGGLSSLAIHICLQIGYGTFGWNGILVGSLLGLTVGLIVGLPSGVLFWLSAKLGVKKTKVRKGIWAVSALESGSSARRGIS